MAKTATVDAKVTIVNSGKENKDRKTKKLEKLLALYIQRAADSLRENEKLEKELAQVKKERNSLRQYWKQSEKQNKIRCNRDKAMIQYGDVNLSEVLGSE